jgi:hypothetical protein
MAATIHTATRAYAFSCTYDGNSWIDNPSTMISGIQTALGNISNFSYQELKVANVKNSNGKKLEVEITGITYNTKTKLTASETDDLIDDLNTALLTVTDFTFQHIDICSDVFSDDPTSGWPGTWKRG